ncbi:MAG: EAL domain-containing protein [Gammaproteobacteria bacterium]|nr:EAL domain-containing protein [Gammaproteobacteria bacterium]
MAAFQKAQPYNEGAVFSVRVASGDPGDQLKLVYQPQIDLHTGGLMGVEALLRWEHHCRGSINPTDFMGLAEDAGITDAISTWTLEQVAKQLKAWRRWPDADQASSDQYRHFADQGSPLSPSRG